MVVRLGLVELLHRTAHAIPVNRDKDEAMRPRSAADLEAFAMRAIERRDADAARRFLEAGTSQHVTDAVLAAWQEAQTTAEREAVLGSYLVDELLLPAKHGER
jgi:hypothetical protein